MLPAMENDTFAPPAVQIARENITALIDAIRAETGLSLTAAFKWACDGDPKFSSQYLVNNFSFGRYDTMVSRLSAVWPEGLAWPRQVPRQAPADLLPEDIEAFHRMVGRASSPRRVSAQPTSEVTSHG